MLRKIFTMCSVLFALFAVLATSGTSFAASTKSPAEVIASFQKTCAVTNVYLHGTAAPTITCASAKLLTNQQSDTRPNTTIGGCGGGFTMDIWTVNANRICFFGTGYLPVNISQVQKVGLNTINAKSLWFVWYYNSPGRSCTITNQQINPSTSFLSHPVLVTQVYPGGNSGNYYCGN